MAEKEGGDSKFMLGFVVGFLAGVLIALGVGASLVMVRTSRENLRAHAAMEEAMMAREMAEVNLARAEQAARNAKQAKEEAREPEQLGPPNVEDADADKVKVARAAIRKVEAAVEGYRTLNAEYPPSLDVLAVPQGDKPAPLEEKDLLDPWERPYLYDLKTRHPRVNKPLIYSQGAEPGKSPPIRNWEPDAKDDKNKDS